MLGFKTGLLQIGQWRVDPASGEIARGQASGQQETARLDTRALRLLLALAERAGEVVSIDDLLTQVWPEVTVSQDSVYQAVTSLRRVLGDDPRQPSYIATVPRLGYRMVAPVGPWADAALKQGPEPAAAQAKPEGRPRILIALSAAAVVFAVIGVAFLILARQGKSDNGRQTPVSVAAAQSERSIAVLPFLDLTEGMKNEEFADGMTEELIDKLSKIPQLRVASATSSFYYKGKQETVEDIARALGVAYVLDGSVRKAGGRVRVAARLVRAESGYVVWTESYNRPFDDILMVQDDIAGEVTKALTSSTEFKAP